MRHSPNTQVWSIDHPDFLLAPATRRSTNLVLYDQAMRCRYTIGKLASKGFGKHVLIAKKETAAPTPLTTRERYGFRA